MRVINKFKKLVRQNINRWRDGVLILLYHRIADLPLDPYLLNVTPQNFAEHLAVLKDSGCTILSLCQLVESLQAGNIPHRGIVVTFDDGYADNLYQAKPLLNKYQIPATVFVTSGYVGQQKEFWWDEVERLLLQPGIVPQTLELTIKDQHYQWHLGNDANYSTDEQQRDRHWHFYQSEDPSQRHRLFRALHEVLNPLSIKERCSVLEEVARWSGMGLNPRSTHRIMLPEEVKTLAADGLIEVGAHTLNHPVLSSLCVEEQRQEIQHSKAILEDILGHRVPSFAYPHGSKSDYTKDTVEIVRESGFTCTCSNFAGMVRQSENRFQLPRVLVYDCNGETFARQLQELLLV
ncbi:MAG TPA: polysaccharide deacetylase family protein [Coleofasciculaceae cyanobacterium]|jgi:peptidoglycan/xylan/chitin deacetylase (PgdA/CDA1 family)